VTFSIGERQGVAQSVELLPMLAAVTAQEEPLVLNLDVAAAPFAPGMIRGGVRVGDSVLASRRIALTGRRAMGDSFFWQCGEFKTDEDGYFVATGLVPGVYALHVIGEGGMESRGEPEPESVVVRPGQTVEYVFRVVPRFR